MPDVITIGNALVDSFLSVHSGNLHTRINTGDNELCVRLGEKVLLDSADFQMGGNACNVAVGLSRLGFTSQLFAEIGEDAFGEMILSILGKERVDTSAILRKGTSSFAIGINFQGDRTLFVHHEEREHAFPFEQLFAKLIFLTSLGKKWHAVYQSVAEAKKSGSFLLAVNPGTPQIAEGRSGLTKVLKVADMLFVNKEEAQAILSTTEGDHYLLLSLLSALGPKLVVLMDGEHGSFATDQEKTYYLPVLHCPVIEKTGAGDSYTAAFLAGYLLNKPVADCMRFGNCNAAAVIGKTGAQPGLLGREELEKAVEKAELVVEIRNV